MVLRRLLTTLACLGWLVASVAAQGTPPAQDGFVSTSTVQVGERLPATPLVFTAYAFVWVALLTYVFILSRKLVRVEGELADVTRKLSTGPRR